jgi:hypothetical protein
MSSYALQVTSILPVRLSVYPPIRLSNFLSIYWSSVYPHIHLFVSSSVCLCRIFSFVRLSVCPSAQLSIYPSIYLSVYPSVRLLSCTSIHLSVFPPAQLCIYPSIDLFVCSSVRTRICLSVRLYVYPSGRLSAPVCPSVLLSVCRSVRSGKTLELINVDFAPIVF